MNRILRQLRHRLFSGRRYDHGTGGISVTETPYQSSCWVVSRALTAYHRIDLNHVEAEKRLDALENQLTVLSPYEEPGYWVDWEQGLAQVWVWDREVIERAVADNLHQEDRAAFMEILPESAFSPKFTDGLQLIRGMDGFFIQYWYEGVLMAERFWPDLPGTEEIQRFARGAGARSVESFPEPVTTVELPWRRTQALSRGFRRYERQLVAGMAVMLVFLIAFEAFSWSALQIRMALQASAILELEQQAAPVVALRNQVLQSRDRNHVLMSLKTISQLALMAELSEKLPAPVGDSGRLSEWSFATEELSLTINDPVASLEDYAKGLDEVTDIGSVELAINDRTGDLVVRARLNR